MNAFAHHSLEQRKKSIDELISVQQSFTVNIVQTFNDGHSGTNNLVPKPEFKKMYKGTFLEKVSTWSKNRCKVSELKEVKKSFQINRRNLTNTKEFER